MSSMYEFSVPVLLKGLNGLKLILEKAKQHGVDESVLLADTLAPDMFPFVRQVQITCDNAKGVVSRLSGVEVPNWSDTETTIAELIARADKTIAYLNTFTAEQFVGAEDRQITLPYFPDMYMTGYDYLHEYALANFFFHLTTSYALIRKAGVAIGKADYLAGIPLKPIVTT